MELLLSKVFRSSVNKFPDKTAISFNDVKLTYSEVENRANRVANALLKLGLEKGDRCAILMYNRLEWLEIYFAMAQTGIIAVPVNFRFEQPEIEYVLNNSGAKAIIFEKAFFETVLKIKNSFNLSLDKYICLGENNESSILSYDKLLKESSGSIPRECDVKEIDPFFIGYTSGTTGFPKGAVVTHRDLILHYLVAIGGGGNELTDKDIMLLIMPIFHSNSTWFVQIMAMLGGTTVVYPSGRFDAGEILSFIEKERITFTSVVPTMLTLILNLPQTSKNKDVSSLRSISCGSAPLMAKTKEEAIKFFSGVDIVEGYGSTETGIVTVLRPEEHLFKPRSVGRPRIGKEVRLLDDKGNQVPTGEIGELYAKGIGILLTEYWQNPKGTKDAFKDGWCTVGDMARQDEDGYFYLEDRKKDMIISGGENIYPTEVENVISRHPKVLEVAIIGLHDEMWGEKVHAVIVLKDQEAPLSKEEIIEFCRGKIAKYKTPKSIAFAKELPKSATGKIVRRQVRELYS
jgi:long-chain acyl-CoA synthetase